MEMYTKEELMIKLSFGGILLFLGIIAKLLWKWGSKLLAWMFKTERKKFSKELLEEFMPIIVEKLVPIITTAVKVQLDEIVEENKKRYDILERRLEHYNRNTRAGKQGIMMLNIDCVNKISDILADGDLSDPTIISTLSDQRIILNHINQQLTNSKLKDDSSV